MFAKMVVDGKNQPDPVSPINQVASMGLGVDQDLAVGGLPRPSLVSRTTSDLSLKTEQANVISNVISKLSSLWSSPAVKVFSKIYLAGFLVSIVFLILRIVNTVRLVKNGQPLDDLELSKSIETIVGSRVNVVVSPNIGSPYCVATPQKTIVLSSQHLEKLDSIQMECVLRHEAVHLRRKDWIGCWIEQFLRITLWFHPVTWVMTHKISEDRELSCDAIVVRETRLAKTYAKSLLACCQTKPEKRIFLATGFNSAVAIKRRLEMLKFAGHQSSKTKCAVTGLVFLAVCIFCGGFQAAVVRAAPPQSIGEQERSTYTIDIEADRVSEKRMSAEIDSISVGETPGEIYDHLVDYVTMISSSGHGVMLFDGFTYNETVISTPSGTVRGDRIEAREFLINLPEGSNNRALINAEKLSIESNGDKMALILTDGQIRVVGHDGKTKFTVIPSGEILMVETHESLNEVVMKMASTDSLGNPANVVVEMDANIGDTTEEATVPYRSIRYQLQDGDEDSDEPIRVKMQLSHDITKLKEAIKQEKE